MKIYYRIWFLPILKKKGGQANHNTSAFVLKGKVREGIFHLSTCTYPATQ